MAGAVKKGREAEEPGGRTAERRRHHGGGRRVERALGENHAFSRSVLDALSANIAIVDGEGVIVSTNRAWLQYGMSRGADPARIQPGVSYFGVCRSARGLHSGGALDALRGLEHVLGGRPEFNLQYRCPTYARDAWFLLRATPLRSQRGAVIAHIDISDLKRAEGRLRVLEESSTLLATALEPVSSIERLGRYLVSRGAGLFVAYLVRGGALQRVALMHADASCDRRLAELALGIADSEVAPAIRRVVRSERPELVADPFELLPPHRHQRAGVRAEDLGLTSAVAVPLLARGRVLGALGIAEGRGRQPFTQDDLGFVANLADRAAVAVDAARLHEELRRADAAKDHFLAVLAHELRNPMGPVLHAVELLRSLSLDEPRVARPLDTLERQVRHQARLLDDLLDVSRIARGTTLIRKAPTELRTLLRQTADDYRLAIDRGGLSLTLDLPEAPVWVDGDPTRLAQIIGNLLHNAIKFTERGGAVHVGMSVDPTSRRTTIAVRDTGTGMTPQVAASVFDAFTQADQTLSRTRGGLGLGLALVKGLVELHGGEVHARSEGLGRGSEFTVRLPLGEPASVPVPARTDSRASRALRVVVIDDNSDAAEMLCEVLQAMGHQARPAYAGREGIALVRTEQPDLVLCDIGLPGIDGYQVAAELRRDPCTAAIPLVAVSGYGQEADRSRAFEAGFDRHMVKPIHYPELKIVLELTEHHGLAA